MPIFSTILLKLSIEITRRHFEISLQHKFDNQRTNLLAVNSLFSTLKFFFLPDIYNTVDTFFKGSFQ